MLSEDWNVKWSGKVSQAVCAWGGFWCGTGVVLQIERSLLLPKQPFITTLCSANHVKTLVNKGTTLTLKALTWTYAHMCARARTHTNTHSPTSNTKRGVYFWRTVLFFQACFCHYHSCASSCLKLAGCRTAPSSLCRVGCAGRADRESRCCDWGCARRRRRDRQSSWRRRGNICRAYDLHIVVCLISTSCCHITGHFSLF